MARTRRKHHWQPIPASTLQPAKFPCSRWLGLPGSIDNDLSGTDMAIGVDSALNHIVRAIDDLSSTAASHQRTFVIETMGRNCGYLALAGTLATGASWMLIPEEGLELRWHQRMVETIDKAGKMGRPHRMVLVAEGARRPDGLVIESNEVRKILAERLGAEVRLTVLGHVQRGGPPTAFDRILSTRLGVAAVDLLLDEPDVIHRHMVGIRTNRVVATPLIEVVEKSREVHREIENGDFKKAVELRGETIPKHARPGEHPDRDRSRTGIRGTGQGGHHDRRGRLAGYERRSQYRGQVPFQSGRPGNRVKRRILRHDSWRLHRSGLERTDRLGGPSQLQYWHRPLHS